MSAHVCMFACLSAWLAGCLSVGLSVSVCLPVCLYARIDVCTYGRMYVCMCVCMCACMLFVCLCQNIVFRSRDHFSTSWLKTCTLVHTGLCCVPASLAQYLEVVCSGTGTFSLATNFLCFAHDWQPQIRNVQRPCFHSRAGCHAVRAPLCFSRCRYLG